MHLDGNFADADFSRYLLVHLTRCHQSYNVTLTLRKGFETGSRVGHRSCAIALYAVALERNPNCIQEILLTNWLREKFDGPGLHRPDRHGDIAVPGDKHDGNSDLQLDEFILNIKPA